MPFKIIESQFTLNICHRPNKKALEKIQKATGKIIDLLTNELSEDHDIKRASIRFNKETDVTEWFNQ